MNTKIYIFTIVLFAAFSCSDNDSYGDLSGKWTYLDPHFNFDYAQEKIEINMGTGAPMSVTPDDVTALFRTYAASKMGDYFEGIEFTSSRDLHVYMQFEDGKKATLKATYTIQGNKLGITLNKESLYSIAGKELNIPELSFEYVVQDHQLTLYLNWKYLKVILNMFLQNPAFDQILSSLVKTMLPQVPEVAVLAIVNSLKSQITTIVPQVRDLEIGVVLTAVK